jgi:hypothetical protein
LRLRQIAIATHDLEGAAAALTAAFGLKIAYRDPLIIHYGLKNALLPVGGEFIEVLQPVREDASAARFLARRGGDAGYMLIFQAADAWAERARVEALGVRVVDVIDHPQYRAAHFHPHDFGGTLSSIDEQRTVSDHLDPFGEWRPAGPNWRDAGSGDVVGLKAAVLASKDPEALARRFSTLLGRPLDGEDPLRLPLDRGELRFVVGANAGTAISAIELTVAEAAGRSESIAGVRFDTVG